MLYVWEMGNNDKISNVCLKCGSFFGKFDRKLNIMVRLSKLRKKTHTHNKTRNLIFAVFPSETRKRYSFFLSDNVFQPAAHRFKHFRIFHVSTCIVIIQKILFYAWGLQSSNHIKQHMCNVQCSSICKWYSSIIIIIIEKWRRKNGNEPKVDEKWSNAIYLSYSFSLFFFLSLSLSTRFQFNIIPIHLSKTSGRKNSMNSNEQNERKDSRQQEKRRTPPW